MTVEELLTIYNILGERVHELYSQQQEAYDKLQEKRTEIMTNPKSSLEEATPFQEKYNSLFDEASKAYEAFEAFKNLEFGCARKEVR